MKILIIGFAKIAYMPYINFYIDNIKELKNDIHVFYWKRDEEEDLLPKVTLHSFNYNLKDSDSKIKKMRAFYLYKKNLQKLIKIYQYDKIVVLTTIPGLLIYRFLKKNFNNNYIFDFRDITYENINLYKKIVNKLIENSFSTFISSEGFKKYLNESEKIKIIHNIEKEDFHGFTKNKDNNVLIIRFWGYIRNADINIMLIKSLANDKRFEIHYHGKGENSEIEIKKFCERNNINNVFFHGKYLPNEKESFISDTHIINNLYAIDKQMAYAISNKFYDGIFYGIPQICNKGSLMGRIIQNKKIGILINLENNNLADYLYNEYYKINNDSFINNCINVIHDIKEDMKKCKDILTEYINKWTN